MNQNLTNFVKTMRLRPDGSGYTVAAGAANVASDIVDMAGFEGCRFIVGFGAIVTNGVQSVNVQQNTANSSSGMADLEGTGVTVADDDDSQIVIIDVFRPRERYLRVEILRATQNSTIDFLIVEQYRPRILPVPQTHASVCSAEIHASPAEGTV